MTGRVHQARRATVVRGTTHAIGSVRDMCVFDTDIPFDDLDDPHSTTALHPSRSSRPWDDPSDADPSSSSSSSREPLQRIDALPAMFRPIFPYPCFNRVQTRCFHRIYYGDENIVIAAPTGQQRKKGGG